LTPPRVLVVDDQPGTAYLLATMASSCNCDVRIATAGAEAIEIAAQWRPAVVLLDLLMPGMDGFQVAERLPEGTKIVAVTALSPHDKRVQEVGFDRYLVKPVLTETVSHVIRQLTA
jgi:CheY-like chemotaxis protein